ncbi:MAG TPA: hypothetical protein DCE43_03825 [Planctomycetaceae bacterium]|jgi:predicted molibdopterin-dependent oxidoreductase YjgC|nr:hypothetical protein [Planctomycetaceae bacterium]|tara:strand:+ start:1196 stop:1498 length:303 start_codon:yes stop_codon:yes gene_type:complete
MSISALQSETVQFEFEGRQFLARPGQSVAAALWSAGEAVLRTTAQEDAPRGFFCGMGVCFDCLVTIDGRRNRQGCLVPVTDGMVITRQHGTGKPAGEDEP